jgi:hypothetical protein
MVKIRTYRPTVEILTGLVDSPYRLTMVQLGGKHYTVLPLSLEYPGN